MSNKVFKLLCVGNPGVGKTCLAYRYVTGMFKDITQSTIITSFLQKKIGDIRVDWYDSAGQEAYRSLTVQFFRGANAGLVVFTGQNFEAEFKDAVRWCRDVREQTAGSPVQLIMVENKVDLERNTNEETVRSFCEENDVQYFKISVKSGEGLGELFKYVECLVVNHEYAPQDVQQIRIEEPQRSKKCC